MHAIIDEPTTAADAVLDEQPEADARATLTSVLVKLHERIPPLWRLQDYVAVNPFMGWADHDLLATHQAMSQLRSCELLMSRSWFRQQWSTGRFGAQDVEIACNEFAQLHPQQAAQWNLDSLIAWLTDDADASSSEAQSRAYHTAAQQLDAHRKTQWEANIVDDISRLCASHYDENQAMWKSPWRHLSLYEDWKHTAAISRRMEKQGLAGFRQRVKALPAQPLEAVAEALEEMGVPQAHWLSVLSCELYSVAGWASFIRQRVSAHELQGQADSDFIALLAIRLTYDVALLRAAGDSVPLSLWPENDEQDDHDDALMHDTAARAIMQLAMENAYRASLLAQLQSASSAKKASASQPQTQMVFCIDVRSEVIRRHLETLDPQLETVGFAGFFGLPLELRSPGHETGVAQCPALLQPSIPVHQGGDHDAHASRSSQWLGRQFGTGPSSCFHFVECLGGLKLGKLLAASLGSLMPARFKPQTSAHAAAALTHGLSIEQQCELAQNILKNTGLGKQLAPLVILCGHGSDVTNNPYQASLDCGACGGHSGLSNARVAAAILNNPHVREALAKRNIVIPQGTHFLSAVHHTTTDHIELVDLQSLPSSHEAQVRKLQDVFAKSQQLTAAERITRMGDVSPADVIRRSRDWAEVRPEWGLAGNAAFIAGPRSITARANLNGRSFLHSYDAAHDPDGSILELIMTAPMVVASWINLQYYASTVDNHAFGSGNKTIHNVVGQLGVIRGNGGDLTTGLPLQSVHNGQTWEHQPLRLTVILCASTSAIDRVLKRHEHVRDLVHNQWINLIAIDQGVTYQKQSGGQWVTRCDAQS